MESDSSELTSLKIFAEFKSLMNFPVLFLAISLALKMSTATAMVMSTALSMTLPLSMFMSQALIMSLAVSMSRLMSLSMSLRSTQSPNSLMMSLGLAIVPAAMLLILAVLILE